MVCTLVLTKLFLLFGIIWEVIVLRKTTVIFISLIHNYNTLPMASTLERNRTTTDTETRNKAESARHKLTK